MYMQEFRAWSGVAGYIEVGYAHVNFARNFFFPKSITLSPVVVRMHVASYANGIWL